MVLPVIRVLSYSHYGASDAFVILDSGRHVLRNHHGILLLSEKIDFRLLCLFHKGICLFL